jgi:hypothetical protein
LSESPSCRQGGGSLHSFSLKLVHLKHRGDIYDFSGKGEGEKDIISYAKERGEKDITSHTKGGQDIISHAKLQ